MNYIKVELSKLYWIILICFFVSCGKRNLAPDEFVRWVEDAGNGLTVSKEFDNAAFQIIYKPTDYIVAKELLNGGIKKDEIPERLKDLDGMQYFTLRIKSTESNELLSAEASRENEYYERLEYFMDNVQNDLWLVEDKDTIPCALSHYERNYGLAPYNNFVIAFAKNNDKPNDKIFIYNDRILGTGKVMFKIKAEDINNIPTINWK